MHHKATKNKPNPRQPHIKKATKHIKSTPKPSQKPQNGLGLLSKTHTLTPPRQAISLLALAAIGVRTYAATPKQKAKPHRVPCVAACLL